MNAQAQEGRGVTPFLKWAGGKRWLANNHIAVFPATYERYIEPFLGSGAIFFRLSPARALLTDVNEDLINLYKVIRDDWSALSVQLKKHSKRHSDDYYYAVRHQRPASDVSRAARFLYLNRTCWNGLYRVNRRGEFNVPRGTKDSVLLDSDDFQLVAQSLRRARLEVCDFERAIDRAEQGDLIFADPPYTVKHNNNGFIKYNDRIFSWDDQVRLRDALVRAHERGAMFVLTNAFHESVRELYEQFELRALSRSSVLAGEARARGGTEELLVTNY